MPTATLEMIDPKIRDFVTSKRRLLIDGKWVDAHGGGTFPVYNPATGEVLDECAGPAAQGGQGCWGGKVEARNEKVSGECPI